MEKNQGKDLSQGSVGKLLFSLAVPAIISQLVNLAYNMVDRIYIGQGVGSLALTGVGVCLPLIMLISASASLAAMGGAPQASIYMGKGDRDHAEKILGNCTMLLIVVAVVITVLYLIFGRSLLMFFGASDNTIGYAWDYMSIYCLGTIFVQMTLGLNAFISAQGFARTSMLTVTIGAVTNIVLDPVFIFAFKMGVKGAALATIISQCVSMIWTIVFLTGNKTNLRIRVSNMKPDPAILGPCVGLGLAPFIMQSTESILSICFNSSLLKYGGDVAVGAMTVMSTLSQFTMLPLQGLAQGAQPIISFNYGAGKMERVQKAFRLLLISSLTYSLLFWAALQLFPQVFFGIFTQDAELIEFGSWAIHIYLAVYGLMGIQLACQQSFVALGNMKCSVFVALLRKVILLIPLIYILPAFMADKTTAVFMAEPVADIISITTCGSLFAIEFGKLKKQFADTK